MKRLLVFLLLCLWINVVRAQFSDDFSSAEQSYVEWWGDWDRFTVTKSGWLQTQADEATESVLWHDSEASIEAEWLCRVRISGTCSAYNMIRFYVTMQADSMNADGYFVQVGGANKNIVLYQQTDAKVTKRIENESRKKILSASSSVVDIRLVRSQNGCFRLYSRVDCVDADYVEEGSWFDEMVSSTTSALWVRNSKLRGYDFYVDNVDVQGIAQEQLVPKDSYDEIDINKAFLLRSETFTPNGDGWEDEACIDYTLPSNEYSLQLSVFATTGQLIAIVKQEDLSNEIGEICWNGKVNGGMADIGVYVLQLVCTSDSRTMRKLFNIALLH